MSGAQKSWSGPGIVQTFITLPQTSKLSQQTLEKWLDEAYIPGVVGTEVVQRAWRYKAANPEYGKQNMLIYEVADLAQVQAGKLEQVPRTSTMFPTDEPAEAFIQSDSRMCSLVEAYELTQYPQDATTTIIYAAMEPKEGGAEDLDAWYRQEHNQQMSEQPGWKRTKRFNLLFQHRIDGKGDEAPSFLAIHEFGEGHKIGKDVEPLEPITAWTRKCMSNAKAIDAAVYHKVKSFS